MTEFKDNFSNLKKNINGENSKILSFLIYGIFIGRLYEKIKKFKKNIRLKKMNKSLQKFVAVAISAGVVLSTIAYFLLLL